MATALFVCLHNAGRSQMSAALFERAAGGRHRALSAGTTPGDRVHPEVVTVMDELGIDLRDRAPPCSPASSPRRPTSWSRWAAATSARTSPASVTSTGISPTRRGTRAWCGRHGGVVVVGGRTAVWAPLPDLAAVVVLDEGDEALQEERVPTWHARDVALERARRVGAPVTLVAPAADARGAPRAGRSVSRPERASSANGWPHVEVVDQRAEPPGNGLLSEALAVRCTAPSTRASARCACSTARAGRSSSPASAARRSRRASGAMPR